MMADVGGNVIALVFAALVALPVGPESAGWRSDVLLRDRSTLAVDGTAGGTVLTRVKALRFAPTLAGALGVLRFAPNDTRGFVLDGTGRAWGRGARCLD